MTQYTTRPAQFRLPPWAHEFLAQEAAVSGASKTDVVLEALERYRRQRVEDSLAQGYREWAEENLAQSKAWDAALTDGLEPEEW